MYLAIFGAKRLQLMLGDNLTSLSQSVSHAELINTYGQSQSLYSKEQCCIKTDINILSNFFFPNFSLMTYEILLAVTKQ